MPVVNLGQISAIHIGTVPPSNKKMLWYDTVGNILKYYSVQNSQWETFSGVGVYVPLAGGTMTGFLTLPSNPVQPLHAVTKQYVDSQVASSQNTLSGILSSSPGSNSTGGKDIVISQGDSIEFSRGSGGSIQSTTTSSHRTWELPDSDGTLLIGTGTPNRLPRWGVGSSLVDSPLLSNGTETGINTVDTGVLFSLDTQSLEKGIQIVGSAEKGVDVHLQGIVAAQKISGKFTTQGSTVENIGVESRGVSSGLEPSYGTISRGIGSTAKNIGIEGTVEKANSGGVSVSVLGRNESVTILSQNTLLAGLYGGIKENGEYVVETDGVGSKHVAVVGHYSGTAVSSVEKYGGILKSTTVNLHSSNIGLLVSAENGGDNYGLLVEKGAVGIGTLTPDKQLVISNGSGSVKVDTTLVNNGGSYSLLQKNAGMEFTSTSGYHRFLNGITQSLSILGNSRVVVGSDSEGHSHLSVVHEGQEKDGTIQSIISSSEAYSESVLEKQLTLQNRDKSSSNTTSLTFETLDSNDNIVVSGGISMIHGLRGTQKSDGTLTIVNSLNGTLRESARVTPEGSIGIGTQVVEDKLHIDIDTPDPSGITLRQKSKESSPSLKILTKETVGAGYIGAEILVTESVVNYSNPVSVEERVTKNATHIVNTGVDGGINLVTGSGGTFRVFTSHIAGESTQSLSISEDGVGIKMYDANYGDDEIDKPLAALEVGGGIVSHTRGDANEHIIGITKGGAGGIVLTESRDFINGTPNILGYKFTIDTDTLRLFSTNSQNPSVPVKHYLKMTLDGGVGVGDPTISEKLTVEGAIALTEFVNTTPVHTSGQGKVYTKDDKKLYYLDSSGMEYNLLLGSTGGGVELYYNSGTQDIELKDGSGNVLSSLPLPSLPFIQDAPSNGKSYVRKDGQWVETSYLSLD